MYSLQTRMKALAIAGVMAASVAGSAVTAFAAPAHTLEGEGVPVAKTVQVADGITLPEKEMEFKAMFATSTVKGADGNATGPSINDLKIKFAKGSTGTDLSKEGNIALKSEFESAVPGEYVYALEEKTTSDRGEYGWTCDTARYILRVYVNSKNGVEYTVVKSDNTDEKNAALDNGEKDSEKLDKATFSNIYTRRGGSGDDGSKGDPSLVVNKTVVGTYGDINQYFEFTVTFKTPNTDNRKTKTFHMTFANNGTGKVVGDKKRSATTQDGEKGEEYTLTGESYVFYLKNGGSVTFDDLPAGTTYTLTEAGADRYTSKFEITQNGTVIGLREETGEESKGLTVRDLLIGENENKVTVTNTATNITITGVVTHSAPFVIMVGALFVAVGGYVVLKKRIEE